MDIVNDVLLKHQQDLEKFKPINVLKHLEVTNDAGHLMCSDPNDLDESLLKSSIDQYLLDLTRDNVQLLVNDVWELPTELFEETVVAKLPAPKHVLPRARKVPVPKGLTKWEKFAKEKGITTKKKDKKAYDTELDKWVPTYGYKRAAAEKERDWVLEVPQNADPMEDQFKKRKDLRNDKVAKNEIKRMKNISRAKNVSIPRTGYLGPEAASANQLLAAATIAKGSTASVGKFQDKLPNEKTARNIRELVPGTKRKVSHVGDEKTNNLDMINSILNKKPKIDMEKAVSIQKREARIEREEQQGDGGQTARKGKAKGGKRRQPGKKPKSTGGKRVSNKKEGGRKRR